MPVDADHFDFNRVGAVAPKPRKARPATKTAKYKAHPGPTPASCEFFGCERRKSLWPYEFDTKTIWLCWPHVSRYRRRTKAYSGRVKHHDFAREHLLGDDYPYQERRKHHDFAAHALNSLG